VGLAVFSLAGVLPISGFLPFWRWWFWLILGFVGEAALVWSSLKDPDFRAKAVADMFHTRFDVREIRSKKLQGEVEQALEYRDRIDEAIASSQEGVLRDHMADVSRDISSWMENIFRLARRLDTYEADETIHRDRQTVEPAIDALKARLAAEDDDAVKRQISQAIAQRQIQRENLLKLESVMERAEVQLESTITAMGTVYSQMMILGSRDVSSGRARRLQQDVSDQVQALQDVVQTMDQVYQAGLDPTGSGLGAMGAPGSGP
jgi:chromosome segregation ATPase